VPILAAYPYRVAGYRNGDHCEIRICGYWQFNVGFNQGASDREGAFDWGQVAGDGSRLTIGGGGKSPIFL